MPKRFTGAILLLSVILTSPVAVLAEEEGPTAATVRAAIAANDYQKLKGFGEKAVEPLIEIYSHGDDEAKASAAGGLYILSIRSDKARDMLLKDIHTPNESLRLAVQWALGRVSSDEIVVKTLLENMRNDPNPLFRDKAACALAHDQVHLTEKQRALLLEGLVGALEDEKDDVRRIALLALQIQTGQTKEFDPGADPVVRAAMVKPWKWWIQEYKKNVLEKES